MKLSKISLAWVRVSILCITIIVAVILVSRQPGVDKLLKKMTTPSLTLSKHRWILELKKTHTLCGHNEMVKKNYQSLNELQTVINGNNVNQDCLQKSVSGYLYVYAMSIKDYCLNCREHQFLGIMEQSVAVIRGTPEKPGPILERLTLKTKDLPQLELEDLRKGIPLKNGNEKLQLIEGLKGLSAD